jgi:hypothetical protein
MKEKFEIRGDVNKTNRSCNQGREESSNIEKIIKLVQFNVGKNSDGKPAQKNQETKSDNDEVKSSDGKYSQTINEVVISQDPQRDDDENENSQDNVGNNQSESDKDKIVESLRTSSRTKKLPSTRGDDFLW